jgi:HD-GYP domain-containing protein (c-di-GMP phosphodiesterase class II)
MTQSASGPAAGSAWDLETEQRMDVLEHLLAIGTALSGAGDLDSLLRLILSKSREITKSDAGSVFLVDRADPGQPQLVFKIAQNDSLATLRVEEARLAIREDSLAGHVALTGKPLNLTDAYHPPEGLVFNREFDRQHGYRTVSMLVLPMLNQQGGVIGVLQLINRKKSSRARLTPDTAVELTQPYSPMESRILMSLASQAAISIERHQLQKSIEDLFEGFVRASVDIIEARDPTTAGHSERVADMTVRLAGEINSVDHGPFRETRFDPRQVQEIRYAALLHDFGKVGVPEAVLLKAKKLYPAQLEAIRYRFALARHELELGHTRERLTHLAGHPECAGACRHGIGDEAALRRAHARLDGYWDLLMRLNEPLVQAVDSLDESRSQLEEIMAYRVGTGGSNEPLVSEQELKQLLVRKGSLTDAERQAIESHVSQTYRFLMQIPWTASLQQVPAIAHGHHEKLDGSGYPLGLTAAQIPLQSQMMTVSDIYDALAASDRPYKKAVPVDRAIAILREEAARCHVNGELVELFEQRRVHEASAR